MLFGLHNIDSPGLIWKIFRNKDLAAGEILLWASGAGRASTLLACQLSRMADCVSVMAFTLVCDEKRRLGEAANLSDGAFPVAFT
jgi:hypothetical protein